MLHGSERNFPQIEETMSIEYVFFDAALRDRFVAFVAARGLAAGARENEIDGFLVELPEDIPDDLSDAIEAEYDALMKEQMVRAETDEDWATRQVMGVGVTLANGESRMVRIEGAMGRRLSEHFTPEEIHELVTAIAQSIENPLDGPLCRKD